MTEQTPKPETRPHRATSKTHQQVRTERLNAALRDNLRRRKASVVLDEDVADTFHDKTPHHDKTNENGG